jgi:nitroreductase
MDTFEAIASRRSIRKFLDTPLPDEIIRRILNAAILAPSGKNRQPWYFIVIKEDKREQMVNVMRAGIEKHKVRGEKTGSSENSARIMEQAPVTIFVFNPYEEKKKKRSTTGLMNVVDVQSTGAAIQNMHLAAQDLGIGALWICDIFYAYDELCKWLGQKNQMIAAVSLGYTDEHPDPRPRKPLDEVTLWL